MSEQLCKGEAAVAVGTSADGVVTGGEVAAVA